MVIYCTTNLVNSKKYIGYDTRNNPKYLGSGSHFKRAIKKYGKENFKKQILEYCDSFKNLLLAEEYWIDYFNADKSELFYNITKGGSGVLLRETERGRDSIERRKLTLKQTLINHPEIIENQKASLKKTRETHPEITKNASLKRLQTLQNNPSIMEGLIEKRKQTLINNPEIKEKSKQKAKQALIDKPEIKQQQKKTLKETRELHPEILINAAAKRIQTFIAHPEIVKRSVEKGQETRRLNPDINIKATEKRKKTFKENPEVEQKRLVSYKRAIINRLLITCPYCNKQSTGESNMRRYHFDNCKKKPIQ